MMTTGHMGASLVDAMVVVDLALADVRRSRRADAIPRPVATDQGRRVGENR